ncbi:MAG: hypothetical protein KC736_04605 [Candidatus Moranbacteria bacterium]|nr:hypothetical protein [Candidatus Moranbacteria bacterium]
MIDKSGSQERQDGGCGVNIVPQAGSDIPLDHLSEALKYTCEDRGHTSECVLYKSEDGYVWCGLRVSKRDINRNRYQIRGKADHVRRILYKCD